MKCGKRLVFVICLVSGVLLSACAPGPGAADVTPTEPARVTTAPSPTPPPSTDFRALSVPVEGGATLAARFYPPADSPGPGVLLLHMWRGQKEDWAPFATRLQEAGYAVLVLDLRGHGESGGSAEPVEPQLWIDDVVQAWQVLAEQPEVDGQRTAIIGASIGANLALRAAAELEQVQAVALLSPGLEYHGVTTEDGMAAYGERPVLIAAAEGDTYAADSAHELVERAQGSPVLTLYPGSAHGTDLFATQPDLAHLLLGWLDRSLT